MVLPNSLHFDVSTAENGIEALNILEKEQPSLIISDVLMPEMDGFELCSKIKGDPELNYIPVILLTTLSDPFDIIRGLENGANNFINRRWYLQLL